MARHQHQHNKSGRWDDDDRDHETGTPMPDASGAFGTYQKVSDTRHDSSLPIIGSRRMDDVLHGKAHMDSLTVISGTKEDNILTGTDGTDILLGKNGDDVLDGGDGNDMLIAGSGDDTLDGGDGNDMLIAGSGDDTLDGGAGSDFLLAGKGDDTLNYTVSENTGETDYYDGGKGFDTLILTLTSAEMELAQADIDAFYAFLETGDSYFYFESFDLTVRSIEWLDFVMVGGENTPPVANPDSATVDEDHEVSVDVLANDTDADAGAVLNLVSAAVTGGLGTAAIVGNQVVYNPGDNYQSLAVGESANVTIAYTISDEHDATASSFIDVVVTGLNDDPVAADDPFTGLAATKVVSPIKVAVVGSASSSYTLARDQLNDSTVFDFIATTIDYTNDRIWADLNVENYDVVVLGESGLFDYAGETGSLFTALNTFVAAGGGVVTTGLFAFALSNNALSDPVRTLADSITPIAPGWTDADSGGFGAIIKVSDPNHEIVRGVADANSEYVSNASFHEFAPNLDRDIDGNLVVNQLATGTSRVGAEVTAIAYDVEVGRVAGDAQMPGGNTAYLGGAYLATTGLGTGPGSGIRDPNGVSDQIFEQAIAWAAGARGTATVNIDTAVLLDNDTDVDSPRDDFTFESFTQPGADGASISLVNGNLVYTLGAQSLQDLEAGLTVEDSFLYTMSDGAGGFDTASVSLSIDTLL